MFPKLSKNDKNRLITFIAIIILAIVSFFYEKYENAKDAKAQKELLDGGYNIVHYLDAGQGDCTLIETVDGKFALIDASTQDSSSKIISYLQSRGAKKLEFVIFTHPHEDHIGCGDEVLQNFEVGVVYMNQEEETTASYEKLIREIKNSKKKHGTKVEMPENGDVFKLGDISFTVVSDGSKYYDNTNNTSICVKMELGESEFLFTGDAEKAVEQDILKSGADIDSDVFKCGHHGSSTSNSEDFLDAVSPKICVASCGIDNDYGHPHVEVVESLLERDIILKRTDTDGDVLIAFNNETMVIL